jgi:DNA-binding MarR family transcriptional regulator
VIEDTDGAHPQPAPIRVADDFEQEYPGASQLASECMINMGVTWSTAEPVFNRLLAAYHLTGTGFNVLEILRGAHQPLQPSTIAEHMLITRGGMTKALDVLENLDYVRRMPHPSDRRMLLVQITDSGTRIMNELLLRLHAAEKEWLDVLTPAEQRTFIELMGKVQARFQQLQRSFKP